MGPADSRIGYDRGSRCEDVALVVHLPDDRGAPAAARDAVAVRLRGVVGAQILDDVLLVVSELVTNAFVHGRGTIGLWLRLDGALLVGQVSDEGAGFAPRRAGRSDDGAGGRGLRIVDSLACRWGVEPSSSTVWFELAATCPDEPPAPAWGP